MSGPECVETPEKPTRDLRLRAKATREKGKDLTVDLYIGGRGVNTSFDVVCWAHDILRLMDVLEREFDLIVTAEVTTRSVQLTLQGVAYEVGEDEQLVFYEAWINGWLVGH